MTCLHLGLAAAMLAASLASGHASAPAGADDAAEWVSKQAIRLRSFEPSDRDFSDLAPLKAAIGEARVVMLGEQTHGDGATFLGKTRLIEFLHEEMGFDVLCFESGLYDCDRAWRALRSGTDAWSAMQLGIFPIWMESRQLAPLTEFMDRAAKSGRPMELCGYDCQLTGPASREHLGPDLRQLATSVGPPALDEAELGAIDGYLQSFRNGKGPEGPVKADGEAAFAKLAAALDEPRFATSLAERDRAFWKQMLRSLPAFGTMMGQLGKPGMSLAAQFNPRDEQGGETLVWLARQRYPDRKIVVWAASMHCIRDPETIDTGSPNFSYQGVHPMGHVASQTLGKEVYVIAFTTGPGEAGSVFRPAGPVPEPPPGSIEAVCGSVGTGPCIVPLRGAGDDTFGGGVFVARPLGNAPMRSRWRGNVDAFAYTPTMVPSTRRATVEEAEAYGDLGTALEKATANAKARCAEQHTYADKGTFDDVWDRWKVVTSPSAAALEEGRAKATAWAKANQGDPCVGWRAHALLAHLAAESKDAATAIAELDAAMAAYPTRKHGDPLRESGYHHLANDRAVVLWETEGYEAAVAWLASRVASDTSMRAFFAGKWIERLETDGPKREALRQALKTAFAERAQRFPEDRASIEWLAAEVDRVLSQ